jgi:hypothetical protein
MKKDFRLTPHNACLGMTRHAKTKSSSVLGELRSEMNESMKHIDDGQKIPLDVVGQQIQKKR